MRMLLRERPSIATNHDRVEDLVLQITRLARKRGFSRNQIVSAMLQKYLPSDAGYSWNGSAALRARLIKAGLDQRTIEHLIASARLEIAMIEERGRA